MSDKGFVNYLKEKELSENTIDVYLNALKQYEEFGGDYSKDSMVDFKWKMLDEKSAKTVNIYLIALHQYCDYKQIPFDVKSIKVQKITAVDNVMSLEQYNRLIDGLEADGRYREALYIKIIAKTGVRISEALKLKQSDFNNESIQMFTKGKVRTIYFSDQLRKEVKDFFGELSDKPVYIGIRYAKKNKVLTTRGFDDILKRSCERYGIPREVAHAHSLRHLFAIEFLKRNNNLSLLADILGHSGLNTTMIYTRLSQQEQLKAINKAIDW